MAISKIRPRHASEGRSIAAVLKDRIDYDKNPDKTKGGLLVSSYQCSADTAWQEFALSKQIYEAETGRKRDPEKDVISYLIIQSFKPGEISPEDANKLGYQLALEFTGGQHQFLVATHVDKRHIHCHIEFNSTTLDCTHKFNNYRNTYQTIRKINDRLCREHGLSVIEKPKEKGKHYAEWANGKRGTSWKDAFVSLMNENGVSDYAPACYMQFQSAAKAADAIAEIQTQYSLPEGSIRENTAIMGLAGQSSNESMQNVYGLAAILFIMVLLAGVLMISGSMNSQVAQRTKFFGMMRCIGASRKQVIRFVRLEALNWCKTAIPIGLIVGTVITWAVCALLRYGIGGEFAGTPVFALSPIGLISGAVVGLVTVLLAAQAPAKRAAKVSPMAAVSGNSESIPTTNRSARLILGKVEWTLGVHHATASKKNWFLMTASFSLSIILFLCFSVGLDFARELVPSLRSWQPDITLNGYANALLLEPDLLNEIQEIPHVEDAYGIAYLENVPATSSREGIDHVNLMSYTDYLLDSAADSVVEGDLSAIYGNNGQVMTISNKDNPLQVGDTIQIGGKEVTITCAVSDGVYSSEYSVICSTETFEWLTGETNYSLIGIQLDADADDETIRQINNLVGSDVIFDDLRQGNQEDAATYLAAQFVLYSFLAIIAMITLFNIINSISMSVTARIKQYGAMRAVGMDGGQLSRMITAESFTYAISGLIVGCVAGLLLSRYLHIMLLTRYFGTAWSLPVPLLCIIVLFDFAAAFLAAYAPSKRIRNMAITETINEL